VDTGGLVITIPIDSHGITIYSNEILELNKTINKKQEIKHTRMYRRFLDKLPFKIILDNKWELFDNNGHLLSAMKTDMGLYIANLQNIMLYMLVNIILLQKIKGIKRGDSFYAGYHLARDLVTWAGKQYMNTKKGTFMKYLPSPDVYGEAELSDSLINSKRIFLEHIGDEQVRKLQPNIIFPETFKNDKIPKKYYDFNAESSLILQFDGSETNEYVNRIYM
jgi:hypothetical protein